MLFPLIGFSLFFCLYLVAGCLAKYWGFLRRWPSCIVFSLLGPPCGALCLSAYGWIFSIEVLSSTGELVAGMFCGAILSGVATRQLENRLNIG